MYGWWNSGPEETGFAYSSLGERDGCTESMCRLENPEYQGVGGRRCRSYSVESSHKLHPIDGNRKRRLAAHSPNSLVYLFQHTSAFQITYVAHCVAQSRLAPAPTVRPVTPYANTSTPNIATPASVLSSSYCSKWAKPHGEHRCRGISDRQVEAPFD